MSHHATTPEFKANAHKALGDGQLQRALGNVRKGFIDKRAAAVAKLPEF
jgi:L-lactate dehydrogenase complex protein LldF